LACCTVVLQDSAETGDNILEPTPIIDGKLAVPKLPDDAGEFAPEVAGTDSLQMRRHAPDTVMDFTPRSHRAGKG
jgi:hypothetical protein